MQTGTEPYSVITSSLLAASKFLVPSLRLFGSDAAHLAIWLTRGQLTATVNGQRHTITPHNAVLIAADTPKTIKISDGSFGSVVSLSKSSEFNLPAPLMIAKIPNIGDQQRVAALLDQLQGETQASDELAQSAALHLGHYFFIQLNRLAKAPNEIRTSAQTLMVEFTKLLERDYRSGRPLFDYAQELGVTTTHLSRISKELNGRSANQLIQDRVFVQARYELATGTHRINKIGADLGFASPAYFTRQFAEKNGLAPREFRDRHVAAINARKFALKAAE